MASMHAHHLIAAAVALALPALPFSGASAHTAKAPQGGHDRGHGHGHEHGKAETKRELGAHQHGHGTLNMAMEGNRLLIELHAPGADIVGFEHRARTDSDKAAIEKAKATLGEPLALFTIPAAAACRVEAAKVALVAESGHGHGHNQEKEKPVQAGHGHGHGHSHSHGESRHGYGHEQGSDPHSEFRAEYALVCDRPDAITTMAFPYFEKFPGAQSLTVNMVTDHGQMKYDAARGNPRIELKRAP
jgi:ABC-type Zn2+ transport system substrate-binding protein/surface adhesin